MGTNKGRESASSAKAYSHCIIYVVSLVDVLCAKTLYWESRSRIPSSLSRNLCMYTRASRQTVKPSYDPTIPSSPARSINILNTWWIYIRDSNNKYNTGIYLNIYRKPPMAQLSPVRYWIEKASMHSRKKTPKLEPHLEPIDKTKAPGYYYKCTNRPFTTNQSNAMVQYTCCI
jgi:hypothetical protein